MKLLACWTWSMPRQHIRIFNSIWCLIIRIVWLGICPFASTSRCDILGFAYVSCICYISEQQCSLLLFLPYFTFVEVGLVIYFSWCLKFLLIGLKCSVYISRILILILIDPIIFFKRLTEYPKISLNKPFLVILWPLCPRCEYRKQVLEGWFNLGLLV